MRVTWLIATMILVALPAAAQTPPLPRPEALDRLIQCRSVSDSAQRLACFDQAAAAFDTAQRQGDVVVVDREQVRESRRQLFGFDLPQMPALFGGDATAERVDGLETTLARAGQVGDGKWRFTLADGSVWRQIDTERVRFQNRDGEPVRVRRAALGSYQMTVGGSRLIRVRREQ